MSINLSIYDVFANTLPGLIYLFAFNELLRTVHSKFINPLDLSSLPAMVAILSIGYILGYLFNSITFNFWYKLFNRKYDDRKSLEVLKQRYPKLKVGFESTDSGLLFTAIQIKNKNLADKIETMRVIAIMMRNVSFGLFLIGVVEIVNFALNPQDPPILVASLILFILSFGAVKQASAYYQYFYSNIFKVSIILGNTLQAVINKSRKENTSDTE